LPFVSVDLPLKGFFWLGPGIFLIVHAYVLLHFALFSDKVRAFDSELRQQVDPYQCRLQRIAPPPDGDDAQQQSPGLHAERGIAAFDGIFAAWSSAPSTSARGHHGLVGCPACWIATHPAGLLDDLPEGLYTSCRDCIG
jgi:hypothetical protein